jgi:MYXO-CTERM domain-containing protein
MSLGESLVKHWNRLTLFAIAAGIVACWASTTMAVDVRVTIRNLSADNSVALSPFSLAAHNGSFDAFDSGAAAGMATENVAELGDGTDFISDAMAAQATAVTATAIATQNAFGPGIFRPGGSGSIVLSLDPMQNRYLSFGAMVVPSNDAFLGNDSPTAVELFDAGGSFVATDFTLNGGDIWDAGTEVNQLTGAAYVVNQDATMGTTEGGVVAPAPLPAQFTVYSGAMTPAGETFSVIPGADTPVASFSFEVVPEPASAALAILALALLAWRQRR